MVLTLKKVVRYDPECWEIKLYWTKRFENYFGRYYDFSEGEPKPVWDSQKK